MSKDYGLLVNYKYCSGCHSCEVACRKEKGLPLGQWGIKLCQVGPFAIDDNEDCEKWEFSYIPVPTSLCDMCEERIGQGLKPVCVVDCQSLVLEYGPVDELAVKACELGEKTAVYVV